jgi:hypothetical protein
MKRLATRLREWVRQRERNERTRPLAGSNVREGAGEAVVGRRALNLSVISPVEPTYDYYIGSGPTYRRRRTGREARPSARHVRKR